MTYLSANSFTLHQPHLSLLQYHEKAIFQILRLEMPATKYETLFYDRFFWHTIITYTIYALQRASQTFSHIPQTYAFINGIRFVGTRQHENM